MLWGVSKVYSGNQLCIVGSSTFLSRMALSNYLKVLILISKLKVIKTHFRVSYLLVDSLFGSLSSSFFKIPYSFPGRDPLADILLEMYLTRGSKFCLWGQMLKCCDAPSIDTNLFSFYYLKGYHKFCKKMTFCGTEYCIKMSINYEKDRIWISMRSSRIFHMRFF